jgi:hypothetical protein
VVISNQGLGREMMEYEGRMCLGNDATSSEFLRGYRTTREQGNDDIGLNSGAFRPYSEINVLKVFTPTTDVSG